MSRDIRKCVFAVNANSKDQDQPAEIYSLIRTFATLHYVPNDSISGKADLGCRCLHMTKDTFSYGAVPHIPSNSKDSKGENSARPA